jgi:hypothetical protein
MLIRKLVIVVAVVALVMMSATIRSYTQQAAGNHFKE